MPRSTDVPVPPKEVLGDRHALLERLRRLAPAHPSSPTADARSDDGSESAAWRARLPRLQEAWHAHVDKWPGRADAYGEAPSSSLDADTEQRLSAAIDKVREAAEQITDKMRSIEAEDPSRHLVGLEQCLKGRDRLLGKVSQRVNEKPGRTPETVLSLIPDAVRYTFEHDADRYVRGVQADLIRLLDAGFEPMKVKNYWGDPEYKGINSQWRDPTTGQRFEVQFHTSASRDAKEFTHDAYERLRAGSFDDEEELELERFQREVAAAVPVPAGAGLIPDYPSGYCHGRRGHVLRDR
jgi:hypothetical protein